MIARLDAFASANIATVDAACQRALNDMEKGLSDFSGKKSEAAENAGTGDGGPTCRRQRRLLSFIKLLDYMICDTLRVVLTDSMTHFLAMTRRCTEEQFEMPLPAHRARAAANEADAATHGAGGERNFASSRRAKRPRRRRRNARTQELAQEAQREAQYQMEEDKLNVFDPKYPGASGV